MRPQAKGAVGMASTQKRATWNAGSVGLVFALNVKGFSCGAGKGHLLPTCPSKKLAKESTTCFTAVLQVLRPAPVARPLFLAAPGVANAQVCIRARVTVFLIALYRLPVHAFLARMFYFYLLVYDLSDLIQASSIHK